MNNVHPVFREALDPFAPPRAVEVSKLCPFQVKIGIDGLEHRVNVLASNSFDAFDRVREIIDNDVEPEKALSVVVHPLGMRTMKKFLRDFMFYLRRGYSLRRAWQLAGKTL